MFTRTDIEKYFIAEKSGSLIFIIIGVAAILLAAVFFFILKTNAYKGMALPLLILACIQVSVGYTVYKRSDADRKRIAYAYDLNPAELKNKEIPRMEKVNRNFVFYRWIWIALIITGLLLIFFFRSNPDKLFWSGVGIGLAIQAFIMLAADHFAEARATVYTKGLIEFTK